MNGLTEASVLQTSDFFHSLQRGAILGAIIGPLAGLLAKLLLASFGDIEPLVFQPVAFLVLAVVGTLFGAWASSLIGISSPNRQLQQFERDLEAGQVLLIVDVPETRIDEIKELLGRPDASAKGTGPEYLAQALS